MAKAGFWLRGARGKLAGASAQKGQNGTILREIVKPRNPKTDKQIYQRAIMATVMKAYSAGKEIFDHAFQGVEKGQKSQQYFIARNATLLRSLIAQDINAIAAGTLQPTKAENACVAPKALYAVPGAYMISEGTYEQNFFTIPQEEMALQVPKGSIYQDNEGPDADHLYKTKISDYARATGLVPGDIYTIVAIVPTTNVAFNGVDMSGQLSDEKGTKQFGAIFGYVRMQVKADVLTNDTVITGESEEELMADIPTHFFDVTGYSHPEIFHWTGDNMLSGYPDYIIVDGDEEKAWGSWGIIRSRLDEDVRSTSYMVMFNHNNDNDVQFGITSPYVLPTWKKGTDSLGTSELILESDN